MNIDKPTVPEVMPLVRALYAGNGDAPCTKGTGNVGGHLHMVLDDGNVEDTFIKFCIDNAENDHCATCVDIGRILLRMSQTQRIKLYKTNSIR